jgi:hypothetical protein
LCVIGYCFYVSLIIKQVLRVKPETLTKRRYKNLFGWFYQGFKMESKVATNFILLQLMRKLGFV